MAEARNILWNFANVAFEKQTYMNIFYLLFSFPLGTAYFIFFITGLSLGFDIFLVWIGIPLFVIVVLAWGEIVSFERQMAIWLLGVNIPEISFNQAANISFFEKSLYLVKNPSMWKQFIFLLSKIPLGVFSVMIIVFLASLTFGLLISPFLYILGGGLANSLSGSLLLSVAGVVAGITSMHLLNLLAYAEGAFAEKMLGSETSILMEARFIIDA